MLKLTDSQEVVLSIAPKTKAGNDAKVDGIPQWFSSNTDVLTLTPAADGMSCNATSTGAIGAATVTVTADADLGAGVENLTGTEDVTVEAGAATTLQINAGAPTEKP